MSKKYIIEIEDAPYMAEEGNTSIALYKAVGFNSLVFDKNGLDKLTPYIADEAYAEGYTLAESKYREARDEIEQEAYQRGLDDAWDAARKIASTKRDGGLDDSELAVLFDAYSTHVILRDYEAIEVVEKIREFEEQKKQETEIHIGDEVSLTVFGREIKGIAVGRPSDGVWNVLNESGDLMRIDSDDLTKTGRNVDLSELFEGEEE